MGRPLLRRAFTGELAALAPGCGLPSTTAAADAQQSTSPNSQHRLNSRLISAICWRRRRPMSSARLLFASIGLLSLFSFAPSQAQCQTKLYRIGILTEVRVEDHKKLWQEALLNHGYAEGKNVIFEARGAAENFDLLPKLANELVKSNVDIILTASTPPAVAAKQATDTIPIVTLSADPVGAGLVRSIAQPGGNVTGIYVPLIDMAAKRVQLLKETVPSLTTLAIVWNPRNSAVHLQVKATEAAAQALGLKTFSVEVYSHEGLADAFHVLHAKRPSGIMVMQDPIMLRTAKHLAEFAMKDRVPAFHPYRAFPEAGGLMSYGVSLAGILAAGASYADKILKGAKPADLPMEQPSRYEFVINLKTAKAFGITIPESILLRADEVIR